MTPKRILILVVIGIIAISLIGVSVFPLITASNQQQTPNQSATVNEQQQDLQGQISAYEELLEENPENEQALQGLLEARLQQGNIQEAIEPLQKLAELHPEETAYQILLAQAKQQTGDLEESAQAYRSILEEQPGEIRALQGLVTLLLQQEQPQAAIGQLQETLELAKQEDTDIDQVEVKLLLAQVYSGMENFDDAIALYEEVAQQNPGDFRPILGQALVFEQQEKNQQAKRLYEKAFDLAPADIKDQIPQMTSLLDEENSASGQEPSSSTEEDMPNLPLEESEE